MLESWGRWLSGAGLCALTSFALAGDGLTADQHVEFKINAPTMVAALIQFTQQSGLQLVFPTDGGRDIAAPRVEGSYTPRAALEQLLQDSGLTFEFVNTHTILVRTREARAAPTAGR